MTPKGGILFFLLILASAALAMGPAKQNRMPKNKPSLRHMARTLMKKCEQKGALLPSRELQNIVFGDSDLPVGGRNTGQFQKVSSTFHEVLNSVSRSKRPKGQDPPYDMDEMASKVDCSRLVNMIKRLRNSSETSDCYIKAFLAPLSLAALNNKRKEIVDSDDYDTLLSAAKPVLLNWYFLRMNLPTNAGGEDIIKWLKMLQEMYDDMSDRQRQQVVGWVKRQVIQSHYECTTQPSSKPGSVPMKCRKPSLQWLDSKVLAALGPFSSVLEPQDINSSAQLCELVRSNASEKIFRAVKKMKPSLARMLLRKFKGCFQNDAEFAEHIPKLGKLVCYYTFNQKLTPDLSKKLLTQLEQFDEEECPSVKKLKNKLVEMANFDVNQLISNGSISVSALSDTQLSKIPRRNIKSVIRKIKSKKKLKQRQMRKLVQNYMNGEKCKPVSTKDLVELAPVGGGIPSCVLKQVNSSEILNDTESLKLLCRSMRKGQLKALLQGMLKDMSHEDLLQKLPECLLKIVPNKFLAKANIDSWDEVKDKPWSPSQAIFLAKKLSKRKKPDFKKLKSMIRGISCKTIKDASDEDIQDLADSIEESPQRVSKMQAGCAARRLFRTLEKERADYFKNITSEELSDIPTVLLLRLPSKKVKDLPASVCAVLLNKIESANLSSLPLRSPSRRAFTKRALLCLANGADLSEVTTEDVSMLGEFVHELTPAELRLMNSYVRNSTLAAMASCQLFRKPYRKDLLKLVYENYGNSSEWTAETLETLGLFLLLDDEAIAALPNEPWMKDVLFYLKAQCPLHKSMSLLKKIFDVLTSPATNERSKREAETYSGTVPNAELINDLQDGNVFWPPAALGQLSNETFLNSWETLRNIEDFNNSQLSSLAKVATLAFGPPALLTESHVTQLGCMLGGLTNEELQGLPIPMEILEEIAECGWMESQLEPVWRAVSQHHSLTADQLGETEMVSLNRFICGLKNDEIKQLDSDAFKGAVGSLGDIKCSSEALQGLKDLFVSVFGSPRTWTEAEMSYVGCIIAGLNSVEFSSLDPSVFSFISQACITLIPQENLAALSVDQLISLGPDNAEMLSREQMAALSQDQLKAMERALSGDDDEVRVEEKPESGAASLTAERILSFLKPLLSLLMGVLLL